MSDTVVLVLAAGRASRFGSTKQLARIDGVPMVRVVVDTALRADVGPVLVVLGHDAVAVRAALPDEAAVVVASDHDDGQARSLAAGLVRARDLGATAAVVLLGDEPDVTVEAVRAVAASTPVAPMVRASYDDGVGHPVRLDRGLWPRLLTLTGDQGARQLADVDTAEVPVPGRRPEDVDRPADLGGGRAGDR